MSTQPTIPPSLSAHFTDGLQSHVVRYQRCKHCGHAQTLARYACQRCGSEKLDWHDSKGLATVCARTVVSRVPSDDFRALAPYTLVIVELDEGPWWWTSFPDADVHADLFGVRVAVAYDLLGDGENAEAIPYFRVV